MGRGNQATVALGCFLLLILLASMSAAQGPEELPVVEIGTSAVQDLSEKFGVVRDVSTTLKAKIDLAEARLAEIGADEPAKIEAEVNAMFVGLRSEVQVIIDETAANSDLVNALSRAREHAIVFREDLARKGPDHPNRDANLLRLEEAVAEYERLREDLASRRKEASEALFRLSQQQNVIVEQIRLDQIIKAQEALTEVVSGLEVLAESLNDLQPPKVADGITN